MAKISIKQAIERLAAFRDQRELVVFIPSTKDIVVIAPTETGDNLLSEDIEEGYNDYLYCRKQPYLNTDEGWGEMTDEDCPMLYFNSEKTFWNEDIADAVIPVLQDMFLTKNDDEVEEFVPLFGVPAMKYRYMVIADGVEYITSATCPERAVETINVIADEYEVTRLEG